MRTRHVLNAGLALAVLAAALALWQGRRSHEDVSAGHRITSLAASDVRTIEIQRRGVPPVRLVLTGDAWRIEAPLAARAGVGAVSRLIELVAAVASSRFPAEDLARFGLDRPWARVSLNGHAIDLGATNEMTRELYVASGGYVYPIPARTAAGLPAGVEALLDTRLLAPAEVPAAVVAPRFRVELVEGRWHVEPRGAEHSQDDLIRWIEQWRSANAIQARPATKAEAPQHVTLHLKDGRTVALGLVDRGATIIVRRLDEQIDFELARPVGERLLAPPSTAPGS